MSKALRDQELKQAQFLERYHALTLKHFDHLFITIKYSWEENNEKQIETYMENIPICVYKHIAGKSYSNLKPFEFVDDKPGKTNT